MQSPKLFFYDSLRARFRWIAKAGMWCAIAATVVFSGANLSGQVVQSWDDSIAMAQPARGAVGQQLARQIAGDLKTAVKYEEGNGVARDPAQAAYWFRKAADLGDPAAQNQMGYLYVWGIGVEKNAQQAIRWFARAAGAGLQQAKLNMAVLFMQGIGVARDREAGRQMLVDLADRKNARAEDYLGELYRNGDGVPRDPQKAEEYFRRSASAKNPEGEFAMGELYSFSPGHEHDLRKAAKYLRESARAGYVPAIHVLGMLLMKHPELPESKSGDPLKLLMRAAEGGIWQSSAMLGVQASEGGSTPPDPGTAYRWFTIAVQQGGSPAAAVVQAGLAQCRATLTASQQQDEERAAEVWMEKHAHTDAFVFDGPGADSFMAEIYSIRGRSGD